MPMREFSMWIFQAIEGTKGLLGCFTSKDFEQDVEPFYIPKEHDAPIPKILPLASEKVRWVGEPVAMIVATEGYLAEDLASLVIIEYEPLEANVDPEKALDPKTSKLYRRLAEQPPETCGDSRRRYRTRVCGSRGRNQRKNQNSQAYRGAY